MVLATVAARRGSLPMAGDAKMLVADGRRIKGTVGGGCVEADVITAALEATATGQPSIVKQSLNADLAGDIGLSCGGTVEFLLEPLAPNSTMVNLLRSVADNVELRRSVTVVTGLEWDSAPKKAAKIGEEWVFGDGAGGSVDVSGVPARSDGKTWLDFENDRFVEWVNRIPRLVICGAGHVGAAIAKLAAEVGFYVVAIDDREEFANEDNVPDAHEILVSDPARLVEDVQIDQDDYVIAATRGHRHDAVVIQQVAASPAAYVGMLGSRRKREVVLKALRADGVPEHGLQRVRTPIGLDIGAETPEEIAVSVVAELIRVRRLDEAAE